MSTIVDTLEVERLGYSEAGLSLRASAGRLPTTPLHKARDEPWGPSDMLGGLVDIHPSPCDQGYRLPFRKL